MARLSIIPVREHVRLGSMRSIGHVCVGLTVYKDGIGMLIIQRPVVSVTAPLYQTCLLISSLANVTTSAQMDTTPITTLICVYRHPIVLMAKSPKQQQCDAYISARLKSLPF